MRMNRIDASLHVLACLGLCVHVAASCGRSTFRMNNCDLSHGTKYKGGKILQFPTFPNFVKVCRGREKGKPRTGAVSNQAVQLQRLLQVNSGAPLFPSCSFCVFGLKVQNCVRGF